MLEFSLGAVAIDTAATPCVVAGVFDGTVTAALFLSRCTDCSKRLHVWEKRVHAGVIPGRHGFLQADPESALALHGLPVKSRFRIAALRRPE